MIEKSAVDNLWVLCATTLVFIMQAGFLCLEAGLTRRKNSINVAIKNVSDFALSVLLFWGFGFAIMFGTSRYGLWGASHFLTDVNSGGMWLANFFLFQAMFCGTAITIVSGAVAERVRFSGYMIIVAILAGIIYPLFGHWAWGGLLEGSATGWLAKKGFVDFAGSTVVHSVGGWAALAAAIVIGPRTDRFTKGEKPRDISSSNLPLAMLGAMLLWFGWIGFNGGSTLELNDAVPGIIANTMLAASSGLVFATLAIWKIRGYPHPMGALNGIVAGLVAITAGCHAVSAASAIIIGAVGGVISILAQSLLDKLKIDDAVSAIPCHMAAGVWGTLAVGLFGNLELLATGLSRGEQIMVQAIGVSICAILAGGLCYVLLKIASQFIRLRVKPQQEHLGLNVAVHHASDDLHDFVDVISQQSKTKDLSLRAPEEPFTEVGQIAKYYNQLMDVLQQSKADIDDLRITQRALRAASEQAQASDKTKSEFLANMSHEIRTPLHGILSFAGFGLKKCRTADPEKIEGYFEKIDISGKRLLVLINDLLDLAKLEAGRMNFEFESNDYVATIANVVDEFVSLLSEKSLNVLFNPQQNACTGTFDQVRIMQVVRNLLNNAIKFSPANSNIDVILSQEPDTVSISVRDYGSGIPHDELDDIFNKFIQSSKTKSGAGGTGLGLSICREIVHGHGGKITAGNHEEGGAIFTVTLPLHAQPKDEEYSSPELAEIITK